MQDNDRGHLVAGFARSLWQQTARALEVLTERQYFAPWSQLASRDCRDC